MKTFAARIFQVKPTPPNLRPGDKPPKPDELEEAQVEAGSLDKAKRVLHAQLTKQGHRVRAINFAPARNGAHGVFELVAYLHPTETAR